MSGAYSRRVGREWQTAVRKFFAERVGGGRVVETGGGGLEAGDLLLLTKPHIAAECKRQSRMDLAGWLDQATRQAPAGSVPVVVHHRKGKASVADAYVTMSGSSLLRLLEGR